MKCPNCGQEMIDIKDYCVRCGKKIERKEPKITLGKLFTIFFLIIVVTVIGCYMIAHYNTEEEIKPFLKNKTSEKE